MRIWPSIISVVIAVILVAIPLTLQTDELFHEIRMESITRKSMRTWLQENRQEVLRVEAEGEKVVVYLTGPDLPQGEDKLAQSISKRSGNPVELHLRWFEKEDIVVTAKPESQKVHNYAK